MGTDDASQHLQAGLQNLPKKSPELWEAFLVAWVSKGAHSSLV